MGAKECANLLGFADVCATVGDFKGVALRGNGMNVVFCGKNGFLGGMGRGRLFQVGRMFPIQERPVSGAFNGYGLTDTVRRKSY